VSHPFSPGGRADPHPAYRWLRAHRPAYYDAASRMWLVTDHAGCSVVLRDPRFSAALGQRERTRDDTPPPSMLNTDPPEHHRLRAPGALLLGPAAVRSIADAVTADVDELVAGLAGEFDAVADVGEPLATAVYAHLLGLAGPERPWFTALARAASANLDPLGGPAQAAAGRHAVAELTGYLNAHVDRLRGNCPLARLAADGRLGRAEMIGIVNLAIVGGWQPLAEAVGNALHWLLPRPAAVRQLRDGDAELARTAVDELLRLEGPIPFTARVATADVRLGGVVVPAGARVLAVIAAANRDPAVFDRPEELVVDRSPNPHLAFGGGAHFCLGAPLVRQAGALLLRRLARQPADLRPAGPPPQWDTCLVPRRLTGYRVRIERSRQAADAH
jgi:cytochrome P450